METWKQIKGLEHTKYLISDKGNVKNKDTYASIHLAPVHPGFTAA